MNQTYFFLRSFTASLILCALLALTACSPLKGARADDSSAADLGKVAIIQDGDIWVKSLPDGEPQRLTSDGNNSNPRWSASGQWLAYHHGESQQIKVLNEEGQPFSVPAASGPFAWSPALDQLAFLNDSNGIEILNLDGSQITLQLQPASRASELIDSYGSVGRFAWSPTGRWLAYEWSERSSNKPLSYQGLWKIALDGSEPIELYQSGVPKKGEAILAGWNASGSHLFFWQGWLLSASLLADGVPLYALPATGGMPRQLSYEGVPTNEGLPEDRVLVRDDFVAAAPAGSSEPELVAITVGNRRESWQNKRIGMVSASSGTIMPLTAETQAAISPVWSPDTKQIAYVTMPNTFDVAGGDQAQLAMMQRHIALVNRSGEISQLTNDPAYRDERPLWSSDGSHLLFVRMNKQNELSLWLISATGGEPEQVVNQLSLTSELFGRYGHMESEQLFDWWR